MNQQLTAMCQMFLFPASVLMTAIGVAQTAGLKVGISLIGVVLSATWIYRVYAWPDLSAPDWRTAMILASVFGLVSAVSLVIHLLEWHRRRGMPPVGGRT
jgi:hypothetical protein